MDAIAAKRRPQLGIYAARCWRSACFRLEWMDNNLFFERTRNQLATRALNPPPHQLIHAAPLRPEQLLQRRHERMRLGRMVATEIADVHIQRHRRRFGPGMHAQVRLGQQHGGRHAAGTVRGGREGVKEIRHGLQTGIVYGLYALRAQQRGIGQQRGRAGAAIQVGCEMQSVHGVFVRGIQSV